MHGMKTGLKLTINTLSVVIIFLSIVLASVYFIYTWDLTRRQLDFHRETAKFVVTIVDARRAASRDGMSAEEVTDAFFAASNYFDSDEVGLLAFFSETGERIYPFSGSGAKVDRQFIEKTQNGPEGELRLEDRIGYYVRYPDPGITFIVYSMEGDLFRYRNELLYVVVGVWFLCIIFILISERNVLKRWRYLLSELRVRFEAGSLRKQKEREEVPLRYGPETAEILTGFNRLIRGSASLLSSLEGKLKECLKKRENLKRLVILYRKYVDDETLLGYSEENITEVTSRRQSVSSLFVELVGFYEHIGDLYPQVITDELSRLYSFLKRDATKNGGLINFSNGPRLNLVFGVPGADENSFLRTVETAERLLQWVDNRNKVDNKSGIRWKVRMGLSCGIAVTGTVGDSYAVIGEVCESAHRMLGHASYYDVPLVTDSEAELIRYPAMRFRKLDLVNTENDALPETYVYEVFLTGDRGIEQSIKLYSHGLEMFLDGRYEVALYDFKKVNKLLGGDPPSRLFLARCERMIRG
jgi:class 3 adenylate cyclase